MKYPVMTSVLATWLLATTTTFAAADWQPSGPIKLLIGFGAGGGVDTQARLLAEDLQDRNGWEIIPQNVPGMGGGTMAAQLKDEPADGLSIGFTVSEPLVYNVHASENPGYTLDDFSYLSTVTEAQMAIVAKADRGWADLGDVIAALKNGENISIGAQSSNLADGSYMIGALHGVELTVVNVKGGKGGLNGVVGDDLDLAWVAGFQAPLVKQGVLVNLASAGSTPLKSDPDAPLLADFDVPYTFSSKFLLMAPAGLPTEAQEALAEAISAVVMDPESKLNAYVSEFFSGPEAMTGNDLKAFMDVQSEQKLKLVSDSGS
ncbi:tripartite tricarboxylate transporter substrate binding protein [Cognatishimia sp. SS12]|uniref:tripartite tricarboxylate transporter substrate binding protein n=1 Tax=Cognatishimia sp. SS12 TaxID=2979465 RepID=UPI00232AF690|nr:tripartite tricarboxylate transporter substrate binding protein [Cognatishimia sp. SS12]MDC0739350.1 tripartite tricarboxylate transporter substrate binding protein [Cognatishimia sp. SS12]